VIAGGRSYAYQPRNIKDPPERRLVTATGEWNA